MSRLLLSAFFLLLITASCKKDAKMDPPEEPGDNNSEIVKIHVQVPNGSSFNPSGSSLLSLFQYVTVGTDSYAQAPVDTSAATLAYVFDRDNKLVMAGFITDSSRIISPATTAKVLLHWGLKFSFLPVEVTDAYINNIDKIAAAREWVSKFEALFKANPFVVSTGAYQNDLKIAIEKIRDKKTLDVNGKNASDVQVDANDIKSGMQVFEDGLSKVSVNNYYRRRAHGFLYKMKYSDLNGNSHTVLTKIAETTKSDKDLAINPRSGITNVMGEVGKYVEENGGLESIVVKSGPLDLAMEENESEVTYKFRIVAPGQSVPFLTTDEDEKLLSLQAETFFFDIVIPAISTFTSIKGLAKAPNPDDGFREKAISVVKNWWNSLPAVYEQVKAGNYERALKAYLEALYTDAAGSLLTEACTLAAQYFKADEKKLIAGGMAKLGSIMTVFNIILSISDLHAISLDLATSRSVEEWEIKARSSKVSLTPDEQSTVVASQKTITAVIKNFSPSPDTHANFEWSTSGKYGYLKDASGHTGASFASNDEKIFYNCNASASALSDGDNWEYIYIKAYYAGQLIGTDTARINVRKLQYKMMPNNITLTGRQSTNNNEVRLYLIRKDNVSDIAPNGQFDFKIVWTTAGKYGKLLARDTEPLTTVTTYDDNSAWYACTDDKVKEATETVTARIYIKTKDQVDYHFLDEVTGTVKIDNDEKKKIIQVNLTYLNGCWQEGNCYTYPVAVFPYEEAAIKYKVMFYNFTGTSGNPPEGNTYTWNKNAAPPTPYSTFPDTKDINGGSYYVCIGRTWCSGAPTSCNIGRTAEWVANYNGLYGTEVRAEVTYYY